MSTDLNPDSLRALGRRSQKRPCRVNQALEGLPDPDRQLLAGALRGDDEDLRRGAIIWLREQNRQFSTAALASHRKSGCSCG